MTKGLVSHFDLEVSHTYLNSYQYPNATLRNVIILLTSAMKLCSYDITTGSQKYRLRRLCLADFLN